MCEHLLQGFTNIDVTLQMMWRIDLCGRKSLRPLWYPCVMVRGALGFIVAPRGFYVEPSSCVQVLVCNMQKWICKSIGMPTLNFLLLLVPLLDGYAPEWMSPLFHFHCWNQR